MMNNLDIQEEFRSKGHSPKLWDYFYKPPGDSDPKNGFIALNDKIETWRETDVDGPFAEYEEQLEVSLETFRENCVGLRNFADTLINKADEKARGKSYNDLNEI